VAALVDTNIVVYRFDGRFAGKQLYGTVRVVNPFVGLL
jgi:hypothetical protein